MTLFENGRLYPTAIALTPPGGKRVPFLRVEMASPAGVRQPVVGKWDTGAYMTMLSFDTARSLGWADPTVGCIRTGTARAANENCFKYYVHRVTVAIRNPDGDELQFVLKAGFAEAVERNLFGCDWLEHVCVATDRRQVHFLRE